MAAAATAEAESCGAPPAEGSDGRGARASYAHAAAATSPSVANRGTDHVHDTERLAATGDGKHGADSQGEQAGLSTRGRWVCQDGVKVAVESLFHGKARANAIEGVIGGDHSAQDGGRL